jgi:hypothetical protein
MRKKRTDILKRRERGKHKKMLLQQLLFSEGLNVADISFIDLEMSDELLEKVKTTFPLIYHEVEFLPVLNYSFRNSHLLNQEFKEVKDKSLCYLYTSDFEITGLVLINARKAFEHCLNIAFKDEQNTCFLLDEQFRYSFTINYYDKFHSENPDCFDIQRKRNIKI